MRHKKSFLQQSLIMGNLTSRVTFLFYSTVLYSSALLYEKLALSSTVLALNLPTLQCSLLMLPYPYVKTTLTLLKSAISTRRLSEYDDSVGLLLRVTDYV